MIELVEISTLHFGALHPIEQALTFAVAFGPFAVLAGVIWWRKRTADGHEPVAEPRGEESAYPPDRQI